MVIFSKKKTPLVGTRGGWGFHFSFVAMGFVARLPLREAMQTASASAPVREPVE